MSDPVPAPLLPGLAGATVGLTGATGHLGGLLLRRLLADPQTSKVVSVARRPLPAGVGDHRLRHVCADLRSEEARAALVGVDLLFHLGAQLWGRGGPEMAGVNVGGTTNVLAARPGAVVLASSAAVYGAWPDNPLPLDERHPPRPNPECPYASQKLQAERRCLDTAPTVVLRVGAVLGPHADAAVRRSVAGYRLAVPAVRGVAQATQFLDEQDAVEALFRAGALVADPGRRTAVRGAVCNVAPPGWLDAAGIAGVTGGRVVALPRRLLVGGSELAHRLGLLPFGADRSVLVGGPLAVDPARAAALLGWRSSRTSAEVLAQAVGRGGPAGRE
ncbi:MAG TPA: NAD-dependent epimerase/dehydratase family protein [Acidimicrobiales bacterium]|nr:NAD-dependent epimerase/dehydratase family protein [Acidimicrobiales bacterium]